LKAAIFDQYLATPRIGARLGHSYNGWLTGTRMRSIEWRYFH